MRLAGGLLHHARYRIDAKRAYLHRLSYRVLFFEEFIGCLPVSPPNKEL